MTATRFMYQNLLNTGINALTVSSEESSFPKANLYNNRRSKVFKPKGRFTITATTNLIYINDGANKTVTLTAGEYDYSTLATHMQTQFNAVSTNFVVAYDYDAGKFNITRTSSGFTLRLSQLTDAAWNTIGFTNNVDQVVLINVPINSDERRNHFPSETIKVDIGFDAQAGFVALIGKLSAPFTVSSTATITLKANTIDNYAAPIVSEVLTATDLGVFKFFTQASCRFWLIEIADMTNPTRMEIGQLFIGDYEVFQDRNIRSGFNYSLIDDSPVEQSERGQDFTDVYDKYKVFSGLSVDFLNIANRDFLNGIFRQVGKSTPFFISFDPTLIFSSGIEDFTIYGKFKSAPKYQHTIRELFSTSFEIEEVL